VKNRTYDALGRLAQVTYADGSTIICGWDAGNAGKRSFPAGTATDDSDFGRR